MKKSSSSPQFSTLSQRGSRAEGVIPLRADHPLYFHPCVLFSRPFSISAEVLIASSEDFEAMLSKDASAEIEAAGAKSLVVELFFAGVFHTFRAVKKVRFFSKFDSLS